MRTPSIRRCGGVAVGLGLAGTVLLSACSSSSAPSIAHAANSTPTTARSSATSAPGATALQQFFVSERIFTECLRSAGLDVADPDSKGVVSMPTSVKLQIAKNPHLLAADRACEKKVLPDPRPTVYPLESKKEFVFDQKMAACLRRHGVPSYPDPVRQTDPSLANVKHYEATLHSLPTGTATFQNALNTCSVIVTGHSGVG